MSEGWTDPGGGPPERGAPLPPVPPPPPPPPGTTYPYGGSYGPAYGQPQGQPYGQTWRPPATGFRAPVGEPRPYPQLLRSPSFRWWRPLLSLVTGALTAVAVLLGSVIALGAFAAVTGAQEESFQGAAPAGFALNNLVIAAAIPVTAVAVVLGYLRPPGWLLSVTLRVRWRWLGLVSLWLAGWALVTSAVSFAINGLPGTGGEQALLLVGLCLLTTPLQAAGEEFLVRGWLTQAVGAWFSRAVPGAVVAGLVSATVFAFLHGSQNVWLFGDRFAFGLVASYLVWRTGGLEAAIVLHTISNVAAIIPAALEGTLDDSLTITEAPVGTVVLDVVMLLVAAVIVARLARRRGIERLGPPSRAAEPVPAR
jgi:membrane protease YdiL (CAAX protease family)